MMTSATHMATQIVLDALSLRGPVDGSPFFMRAVESERHLGADRLRLAKQFLPMIPTGATAADAPRIAATIAPLLTPILNGGEIEY